MDKQPNFLLEHYFHDAGIAFLTITFSPLPLFKISFFRNKQSNTWNKNNTA